MADPSNSDRTRSLSKRINQLAADGTENDDTAKQLALELVRTHHDRINELYYEDGLSDAEAEALALDEADVTTAGATLVMTVTGRSDDDVEAAIESIQQNTAA
ncbi:hypothetical protein [Natronorubrum sulfidifaciens]|uniref:Uncharacterized protein n=1 Tax=Natronorubrum sulfidifaciens JCM 14089 TaxID=1230460 RepID=L9VTC6_9EURY|nr:hypothetical protein [Natronorubrum sulfidifaciens]ELY40414.1 hypothetical protein C495_17327 [Natronorubrum sulfidifaciens JCM 14089]